MQENTIRQAFEAAGIKPTGPIEQHSRHDWTFGTFAISHDPPRWIIQHSTFSSAAPTLAQACADLADEVRNSLTTDASLFWPWRDEASERPTMGPWKYRRWFRTATGWLPRREIWQYDASGAVDLEEDEIVVPAWVDPNIGWREPESDEYLADGLHGGHLVEHADLEQELLNVANANDRKEQFWPGDACSKNALNVLRNRGLVRDGWLTQRGRQVVNVLIRPCLRRNSWSLF